MAKTQTKSDTALIDDCLSSLSLCLAAIVSTFNWVVLVGCRQNIVVRNLVSMVPNDTAAASTSLKTILVNEQNWNRERMLIRKQ